MSLHQNLPSLQQFQIWLAEFPFDRQELAITTTASFFTYIAYKAIHILVIKPYVSALRDLPGPGKPDSYLYGHMSKIFKAPAGVIHEEWAAKYGPTFQYRGIALSRRFFTLDPKAIAHIMNHSYDYPKPEPMREGLVQLLGRGVLVAEGDEHRRQRRIMNPCFGIAQIRELMPIFYAKSFELRDVWMSKISEHSGAAEIDALQGLSRTTLDIIGLAGFNYDFNAIAEGETNELARAFNDALAPTASTQVFSILQNQFPILKLIPTERARVEKSSREVMDRVGRQLVQQKKAALLQETGHNGSLESKHVVGRDILSVLVKANIASNIKNSERMTDDEMIGQITTMLLAGHETTSSSITWLLYDLAKPENKHIQDRLRTELTTLSSTEPSMEELNALPYLDAVIRENLRLNAVVSALIREADKDDVIPLSIPIVDRNGVERREVRIGKGDLVFLSIVAINRDKTIWGEDAEEFNPERWFKPETHPRSADIPGVYSGIMTFIGGPRHCIGYRFALLEMKALVYALIQNMSFSLPDTPLSIEKKSSVVTRPLVTLPDGTKKSYMPLIVKAVGGVD
ncbi:hypothetical protein FRB93_010808 [Tulasnella sp. JGI-2019a]|nr:hypothetical protein FRB93_010808 [Tulasnella sp. JGI-2019a]